MPAEYGALELQKRPLGSVERTGLTRFTGFERQEHENDQKTDSDVDGCQH